MAPRDSKRRRVTEPASINQALSYIREQIATGRLRPTISDLVRLLEIRAAQNPPPLVACWYDPDTPAGTCPVCLRPSDPLATARARAALQAQHQEATQ